MAYSVWFQLYAISYQPYARYRRLASEIFLSSLQPSFSTTCLEGEALHVSCFRLEV
jgi:hypothetical protein